MNLVVKSFSGREGKYFIDDLARLRIEVFKDFPYLYEGDFTYEQAYLKTYTDVPESVLVVAFDGEEVVGVSTGIPMKYEPANIQRPWLENGFNVEQIFYFGESVLQQKYRGLGIGVRFFEEREKWAKQLGLFDILTFCGVIRSENHPLRPKDYHPLDQFWKNRGFQPTDNYICNIAWKDINTVEETEKELFFWWKNLG